jgi:hypothetical protein
VLGDLLPEEESVDQSDQAIHEFFGPDGVDGSVLSISFAPSI